MSKKIRKKLVKNGSRLDAETRARRAVLSEMKKMSPSDLFELAVRAGIYTEEGRLTDPYRDDAEPSACRPTD